MKPYRFSTYLKPTLWGGSRLAQLKGLADNGEKIGESWEISPVPGHVSVTAPRGISDDPDLGLSLEALIDRYRTRLMGARLWAQCGTHFPLLVKFIDAHAALSVQVHPDDALANQRHHCPGKTEMWYVMGADQGATLTAGFRRALTREDYDAMMSRPGGEAEFLDALAQHAVHAGDAFFLPAGRVHAIGAGCLIAEIQQPSDITYRISDYGRTDANGNPRTLHVAEARDAIDFSTAGAGPVDYDPAAADATLVDTPLFRVRRLLVNGACTMAPQTDGFVIVLGLSGAASVNEMALKPGETLLVPAEDNRLRLDGQATLLIATA